MRNVFLNAVGVCAMLSLMASCSSTEDIPMNNDGYGTVSLNILTDTQFESRAVDESYYQNLGNYTVEITNSNGYKVATYTGTTIPSELIELTNDTYWIKAYCGEDKAASTSTMYVEGTQTFDVNSNQVTNVTVTCAPVCARVKVIYEGMEEYFTDWSATFHTKALDESSFVYEKDKTDPIYLKVDKSETISVNFALINKAGKGTTIDKTYLLNPNEALTITVKPVVSSGNLGIEIEIDDTTNDIPVDIVIPSDWV